jgi:hypothetical protein
MFGATVKTWITAGAGTIAAIVVAGLLGAFAALPKPPVPQLPADAPIEAGQWRILPVRAFVVADNVDSSDDIYGIPLKPRQKALVVEVDMTNLTAESTKDYFRLFELVDPAGAEQPYIALPEDSVMSPELHPGMPQRMAYIWPLPPGAAAPSRASFKVIAQTFKPRDNLYGAPGWFNPHEVGTVTLAVGEDRPASAGMQ